jgi:hypothetical protein
MAFTEVRTLDAETTTPLGGRNKKTGKPNPTSVEGYYLGTRQVESKKSKNGKAAIHFFQTSKGNLGVWGKTDMDRKLSAITPGTMVRVSFAKMVPTPNGDMYQYKVEVDADNTIDVSDLASGDTSEASGADTEEYSASDDDSAEETYEADSADEDEDAAQSAQLAALERKQKVEALLKGKNGARKN